MTTDRIEALTRRCENCSRVTRTQPPIGGVAIACGFKGCAMPPQTVWLNAGCVHWRSVAKELTT